MTISSVFMDGDSCVQNRAPGRKKDITSNISEKLYRFVLDKKIKNYRGIMYQLFKKLKNRQPWGSITHQMPAPFPGLSWCVLLTLCIFQKEELNALAINWYTCSHLVLCLKLKSQAPPTRAQWYKTVRTRNLRMFLITRSVCLKPFRLK